MNSFLVIFPSVIFVSLIIFIIVKEINYNKSIQEKNDYIPTTKEKPSCQKCKYNEFSQEQFDEIDNVDGEFTYIQELPHETLFQVINKGGLVNSGNYFTYKASEDLPEKEQFKVRNPGWFGTVIHKEGKSFIKVSGEHSKYHYPIDEKFYLWIKVVKIPSQKQCS